MEVAGVVLTLIGGVVLSWRRLLGRAYTMGELSGTAGRTQALVGFGLVVLGSVLTIIGISG